MVTRRGDWDETAQGQDGVRLHWTPVCQDAITTQKLLFTEGHPTYSPDLNPIENVFGLSEVILVNKQHAKLSKSIGETKARFVEALNEVAEAGRARNAARSMPERLKTVIDCGGYATRW